MRRLVLIIVLLTLACKQSVKKQPNLTVADIEYLKNNSFTPLETKEAHALINEFVLPWLGKSPHGKKLFIHPLLIAKPDTPSRQADQQPITNGVTIAPHPTHIDTSVNWDAKLLGEVRIITSADLKIFEDSKGNITRNTEQWNSKFGYGYWDISYPAYNRYNNILIVNAFSEDNSGCGNGRKWRLLYTRTSGGWKFISAVSN